jgi:tetratricopeptide (TPR) repeat protein
VSVEISKQAKSVLAAIAMVLVILAVYTPAMRAGFVWDDEVFVTENPLIEDPHGLYRLWFTTESTDYFPLTSSILWFEWRLFGKNATGYHIINILLHAANAVLVWQCLKSLKIPAGWLAGLLFAVHPVNVVTVAWITEHKNTISMLFYLLSLILYMKFRDTGEQGCYWTAVILFLAALLSKTSVVMMPFVILGIGWWQEKAIRRKDLLKALPFFGLSLLLGLVTIWFQYTNAIGEEIVRYDGFISRLAVAGRAIGFYFSKALFPFGLSFIYRRWELPENSMSSLFPTIVVILLLTFFWTNRKKWGRSLLFASGYFIVNLIPVLGFLDMYFMQFSLVADHWQYISIIGIMGLLAAGGDSLLKKCQVRYPFRLLTGIAVATAFAGLSWQRAHIFKNEEVLWRDTISKDNAAWMPHNNLGILLMNKGNYEAAVHHFSEAVRIKADYWSAWYNMGNAFLKWKKPDKAIASYSESLRLNPKNIAALNNLGYVLFQNGNVEEAIRYYSEALRIAPSYESAHRNLGDAMVKLGKLEEAIYHYSQVLKTNPSDAGIHYNLFLLMMELAQRHPANNSQEP